LLEFITIIQSSSKHCEFLNEKNLHLAIFLTPVYKHDVSY